MVDRWLVADRKWLAFPACEKCGATEPGARWAKSGDGCNQWDVEHFHLECWRCGWRWSLAVPPFEKKDDDE